LGHHVRPIRGPYHTSLPGPMQARSRPPIHRRGSSWGDTRDAECRRISPGCTQHPPRRLFTLTRGRYVGEIARNGALLSIGVDTSSGRWSGPRCAFDLRWPEPVEQENVQELMPAEVGLGSRSCPPVGQAGRTSLPTDASVPTDQMWLISTRSPQLGQ